MSLTLDALTVLDAIDRKGSFAAAAEELFRVPSAISYTIQKLEQDLKVTLFDRSGHRAILTPAGRSLLEEGRHVLRNVRQLESHVKRIATGWESELHVAVDTLIPLAALFPLSKLFYAENSGTSLHFRQEVLSGTWDALTGGRADLAIAASGEGPTGGGYTSIPIGETDFVFAVAPDHPLAKLDQPLSSSDILSHRAVAVADSSRYLPTRTAGLLNGQNVLTVSDMQNKLEAQCQGLGVGYLPRSWTHKAVAEGRLIIKTVVDAPAQVPLYIAWRSNHQGKAMKWFIEHLNEPTVSNALLTLSAY